MPDDLVSIVEGLEPRLLERLRHITLSIYPDGRAEAELCVELFTASSCSPRRARPMTGRACPRA